MSVFLRGAHAALHPPANADASAPLGPDAWLDAGPAAPGIDEILMEARPVQGQNAGPVALVGLTTIDWVGRTARLCAAPTGGGNADPALLQDALDLVVRYAREELALERVEAAPTAKTPQGLLDALRFDAPKAEGAPRVLVFPDPLKER